MFVTFLVILFSDLKFTDVTIQGLMQWYNYHPFAFILAIQDVILGSLILFRLFNAYIAIEEVDSKEEDYKNPQVWTVYTNDTKK